MNRYALVDARTDCARARTCTCAHGTGTVDDTVAIATATVDNGQRGIEQLLT